MKNSKVCFLLGVMPRSGTNYLANLIECHQDVIAPGPVWEDFFVSNSTRLESFVSYSKKYWNPNWDKEQRLLTGDKLLNCIGDGLLGFLNQQRNEEQSAELLLAKTPTVRNIKNFFKLFPNNKLLILVRDGRSVICSGEKSFKWDFEKASRDWSQAIINIKSFIEAHKQFEQQIKLIRYEDIYLNSKDEMKSIIGFLGLDEKQYDWNKAENLGISGSSDTVDENGKVTWAKKVEKNEKFKPLKRYQNWSVFKQKRFAWLAGKEAQYLGYEVEYQPISYSDKLLQILMDITWPVRVLPRTFYHLIKSKNFILKSH